MFSNSFLSNKFSELESKTAIINHYSLSDVNGLGLYSNSLSIKTIGGLIAYLNKTHPNLNNQNESTTRTHISLDYPQIKLEQAGLVIDNQTRRNLEIVSTQRGGQFQGSLLWAIDKTLTAMGGRCIRRWLEEPLTDVDEIEKTNFDNFSHYISPLTLI